MALCLIDAKKLSSLAGMDTECTACSSAAEALGQIQARRWRLAVLALGTGEQYSCWPVLASLKREQPQCFTVVMSWTAAHSPACRLECYRQGARMVTTDANAVVQVAKTIENWRKEDGPFTCPACGMDGLSENALHQHFPLFHSTEPNIKPAKCPICSEIARPNMGVHIHNYHGPEEDREPTFPDFAAFVWVVCRLQVEDQYKYLLVNEPAGIARGEPRYWLPAGRLDAGESFVEAALRETEEEAGLHVRIEGVLRFMVQHGTPRIVLLASPVGDEQQVSASCVTKSVPDFESVGALWVSVAEMQAELREQDYRSPDPPELFPAIDSGELSGAPIDTEAFRQLEALVKSATQAQGGGAVDRAAEALAGPVMAALRREYPASMFR